MKWCPLLTYLVFAFVFVMVVVILARWSGGLAKKKNVRAAALVEHFGNLPARCLLRHETEPLMRSAS